MNIDFNKVRPTKTKSEVKIESTYDQDADVIVITITGSKKGYKPSKATPENFVCPISTKIAGLESLKLSANLIALG